VSPLAMAVYDVLRVRVPAARPELSYLDLCGRLPSTFSYVQPNSQVLWDALGEIVRACRAADLPLPALPAIVINKDTRVPGNAYYTVAHPNEAHDEALAMIAWGNEVLKVRATTYPPTL